MRPHRTGHFSVEPHICAVSLRTPGPVLTHLPPNESPICPEKKKV
ncbi:unnamed protein product [Staurois parvus]|uniref:Uncharacterized protein n=1 Tax=Staurois parvus TaxID=386267 RepID=A0ABN9A9F0_9NEOB|nr:unnamed protein product [Staurois parvus]